MNRNIKLCTKYWELYDRLVENENQKEFCKQLFEHRLNCQDCDNPDPWFVKETLEKRG